MIYIVFVSYLLVLSLYSLKNSVNKNFFWANCVLIILLVGLRSYDIGSVDTLNYVRYFLGFQHYYNTDSRELETGFIIYNKVLACIVQTGWLYLLINATVSLCPLFYLIKKYSYNIHFSLLLFFIVWGDFYSVYFVCTRQVIGMSFSLWAIILFLEKRKYYIYLFIVLSVIGAAIHTSAPLMIFLFLILFYIKIPRIVYISICVVSFVIGYLGMLQDFEIFSSIFSVTGVIFARLSNYLNANFGDHNAALYPFFRTMFGVLICIVANNKNYGSMFTKLFLVGIVIGNLFPTFHEIYRLTSLFTIFGLISGTYVLPVYCTVNDRTAFKGVLNKMIRLLILLILLYGYYKFVYSIQNELKYSNATLVPYEFFWEDKYSY